jgi:hypothetical protein
MGVSVRLSRNTRVYLPFWVAIPAWLIAAAVWAVILAAMLLWWLLVILPGKAVAAWRHSPRRATREAQRPEVVAAEQALLKEYRQQREEERRQREQTVDAELEEYRLQVEDHEARTHRYRVTACSVDALKGGEFTLEAEGLDTVRITLDAKSVIHFLSLKVGDIVQVTLAPEQAGLEEFWQICRANGAKPRSPIELTTADMAWLGLTANRSESGG